MSLREAHLVPSRDAPPQTAGTMLGPVFPSSQEAADLLGAIQGGARLEFSPAAPPLPDLQGPGAAPDGLHPAWDNVAGMAEAWRTHPLAMDFEHEDSPNHGLKQLERELYLHWLLPFIDGCPSTGRALDAAGGVGRMASPLLEAGWSVDVVDACEASLQAAFQHLTSLEGCPEEACFDLHWKDVHDLDGLPEQAYDLVLAIELLCYLASPGKALGSLVDRLRPGGLIAVSVEGWPGSLLATGGVAPTELKATMDNRIIHIPGSSWTRCYSRGELTAMLESHGLEVLQVIPTHLIPDGPLYHLLQLDRLSDPLYRRDIIAADVAASRDENLGPLARAFLAIGRRPQPLERTASS